MGRTLKMGFAMGGGVSLGSFSGAGLSEAIKQAVLNAGYKDETGTFRAYDKVIVDVFSGASAGSMSLAIMLRGLAYQTADELQEAEEQLRNENIDLDGLPAGKKADLIVAQVVQDLQRKIWVKEINLDRLLGSTAKEKSTLSLEAGLVRRGALEDIARKYFQLDSASDAEFSGRRILAGQVLFASTLSNLTGIVFDTRTEDNSNPNYVGTKDPYTSKSHKELRVFHLLFNEVSRASIDGRPEQFPAKWLRYHAGEKASGYVGDLRKKSAWARIIATSIACGAFPFAFEPVPLERFQFEFGENCWPEDALSAEVCRLAMGLDEPQAEGALSYPFCYVDGGTFNNEPVREAFRMAAFQDAEDSSDFDRVIVFVDPSVGDERTDFRMPFLKQYAVREPRRILGALDGYDVIETGSLDRLLPHIGTLVTMITDEGRVKESNKIMQVSKLFNKKQGFYDVLETLVNQGTNIKDAVAAVMVPVSQILRTRQLSEIVPSGALTLAGELIRVCKDKDSGLNGLMAHQEVFGAADVLAALPEEAHPLYLKALLRIFMDQLMDLSGKNENYKIIAIAPEEKVNGIYKGLDLPGSPLEAFSGFASERANEYAIDLAVYCTRSLMSDLGMMPEGFDPGRKPVWSEKDKKDFLTAFSAKLVEINDRIDSLFGNSHIIDVFFGVDRVILTQLSKLVKDYLAGLDLNAAERQSYRFMIEVDNKSLEIDGAGRFNDAAPLSVDGRRYLITELYYYPDKKEHLYWSGVHVQDDQLVIDRDGWSVLPDKSFCTIALPAADQLALANRMPNPVFVYRKLAKDDSGRQLPAAWAINAGVRLLEKRLLGAS